MRSLLSRKLERLIDRAVGDRIEGRTTAIGSLHHSVAELTRTVARLDERAASALDDVPSLRRQLLAARATEDYERALRESEPLVTVRIPTYVRSQLLVERALPSIMRQTYQNFEVIVVGDGCTNDTAARIEAFGDPRVRFVNLPFRYPYPEDPERRWMVAGSPGMNLAAELATGTWIAFLGDDDEFEPHHLECLLGVARSTGSEMVYGNILERRPPPAPDVIHGSYPPELGEFNCQAAIHMSALRAFEFNTKSWLLDEPADWNLCRRMLEAGVRIGYTDRVVTRWYPSRLFEADSWGS